MIGGVVQPELYGDRARFYDAIYHWKDYEKESRQLHECLRAAGVPDRSSVLEAACGTGSFLVHLRNWYDVAGFDLYEPMLAIARDKLGDEVPLFRADMTSFSVDKPFDAVLCLFSSIGYVFPEERVRAAASRFAAALRPGGVLVVEPWIDPEQYIVGHQDMQWYDSPDVKLCRAGISRREGELAVVEFQWLALESDRDEIAHFTEIHRLWLCPPERMTAMLSDAGFDCRFEPDGLMPARGLIIGRKR